MSANMKLVGRHNVPDLDPHETTEWLEALQAVIERDGPERARRHCVACSGLVGVENLKILPWQEHSLRCVTHSNNTTIDATP